MAGLVAGLILLAVSSLPLGAVADSERALAPDFEISDLDGRRVRFSDYAGRVCVLVAAVGVLRPKRLEA